MFIISSIGPTGSTIGSTIGVVPIAVFNAFINAVASEAFLFCSSFMNVS